MPQVTKDLLKGRNVPKLVSRASPSSGAPQRWNRREMVKFHLWMTYALGRVLRNSRCVVLVASLSREVDHSREFAVVLLETGERSDPLIFFHVVVTCFVTRSKKHRHPTKFSESSLSTISLLERKSRENSREHTDSHSSLLLLFSLSRNEQQEPSPHLWRKRFFCFFF
jgi:hypothetical protein